ncbi:hypothetical protein [Ralstonia sp. UBA689]|uniref:hypothetical protein n=1 Tax=Ralstonia sp. UBA689 TaxID=1947373 RepID=UPI0025DE9E31|nr:hypothetical protein [Ralstonia sp. UBA689]
MSAGVKIRPLSRGQGVSVVASLALPEDHAGVVVRRITPRTSRRVGLACLNQGRLSPAAAALWRQAQAIKLRR